MSFVPLVPIGSALAGIVDERTASDQRAALAALEDRLRARRAEVHGGWGPSYVERVHKKGKLTARERLAMLADPGTRTFEVGTFVNYGEVFPGDQKSPAAGVVTAFAQVEGRWCMVIANDNTVASGAWWPRTPEKIQRAQMMAMRLRLPTLYLVDCSGLFLPEQSKSFPGAKGAGHIFKMNSLLSANGVPQIAGVFGDCIAGGGYMPIISDRVYMTEQAYMVIAGAALIKGAKSQKITSLDIGGPEVHVHQSGCADVRVPDDETLLACMRRDVARLPSSACDFYRGEIGTVDPRFVTGELGAMVPADHREAYDAKQVLARLLDQSLFWEVMPEVGEEMICGVGRINGLYAGFVINRQGLVGDPEHPGRQRPAGILYRAGIAKISAFSRACNDDGPYIAAGGATFNFSAHGCSASMMPACSATPCARCCCASCRPFSPGRRTGRCGSAGRAARHWRASSPVWRRNSLLPANSAGSSTCRNTVAPQPSPASARPWPASPPVKASTSSDRP
jgi:acetyl-CoA carboxylase carboxyltransferase component